MKLQLARIAVGLALLAIAASILLLFSYLWQMVAKSPQLTFAVILIGVVVILTLLAWLVGWAVLYRG